MSTSIAEKCRILKQHETYGYQVAYFLLQNEELALLASARAIKELLQGEQLYREPLAIQRKAVKKTFIKHALIVNGERQAHGKWNAEKTG